MSMDPNPNPKKIQTKSSGCQLFIGYHSNIGPNFDCLITISFVYKLEIITPEEKSYLSCQNEYHSTIVAQMKKYAALKNLPPVTSSKKFHESALFHSKVYAYDDNTNSGFDFFRERMKGISQVILTNDNGSLEDCKSLAIEDINASIGKIEYFWKDPIEIGCAIEASLKSLKTYGICHTYPAIEV